jgi:hypothetical protein
VAEFKLDIGRIVNCYSLLVIGHTHIDRGKAGKAASGKGSQNLSKLKKDGLDSVRIKVLDLSELA